MLPGFVRSSFPTIAMLLCASQALHVDHSAQVGPQEAHAAEQQRLAPLVSVDNSSIQHATLDMSTGRLTRGTSQARGSGLPVPIYNHLFNDQNIGYLDLGGDPALDGPATASMLDEGIIPSMSGGGPADSYLVTHLVLFYATSALDPDSGGPGSSFRISFWDNGASCTPAGTLGTPSKSIEFQGLPGREPWESTVFWAVSVTLDQNQFTLVADSNGVAGDGDGDLFTWSMEWLSDERGGPVALGGTYSSFCVPGSGTFGDESCGIAFGGIPSWGDIPAGHGLGTLDQFYMQYSATPPVGRTEGCKWFGGPTVPPRAFASFQLVLGGEWDTLDTEAPEIICPTAVHELDRLLNGPGEIVAFTVTATDNLDPQPNIVCSPPSGSLFPAGLTVVNCTATDTAGNQSTCSFPVVVQPKARRR